MIEKEEDNNIIDSIKDPINNTEYDLIERKALAFGGGKGGVGRSLLVVSCGIYLAQLGKKVILVDADLGGANLHTFFGIPAPLVGLTDLLTREVEDINDLVIETPIPNLYLIGGTFSSLEALNPRPMQKNRVFSQINNLKADYILLDLGSGFSYSILDFFSQADNQILVLSPEPTAVERTYRFINASFLRKIKNLFRRTDSEVSIFDSVLERLGYIPTPLEFEMALRENDHDLAEKVKTMRHEYSPRIIANMVKMRPDMDLSPAMVSIALRKLGIQLIYLGYIEYDEAVRLSLAKQKPLFVDNPQAKASKNIEQIMRRLLGLEKKNIQPSKIVEWDKLNYYEILEIDPGSSIEDIRKAYRWLKQVYSPSSMACYSIITNEERRRKVKDIEEAYNTLIDIQKRHSYDVKIYPEGRPKTTSRISEEISIPPPPPPDIIFKLGPDTHYSGELLKKIRESQGIDLKDISARSKISITYLKAIEEEDFASLPALVYTRGFLIEVARYFKLDPQQVTQSYLNKYRDYISSQNKKEELS